MCKYLTDFVLCRLEIFSATKWATWTNIDQIQDDSNIAQLGFGKKNCQKNAEAVFATNVYFEDKEQTSGSFFLLANTYSR